MHVFNTLAPVFAVIAVGAALRHFRFLTEDGTQTLTRFCYFIGLPCLLFVKIALAEVGASAGPAAWLMAAGMVGMVIASALAGLLLRLPAARLATLVHVGMRGNLAFIGLPVVMFAFLDSGQDTQAEATAMLAMAPIVVAYNLLGVVMHLGAKHRADAGAIRLMLVRLLTEPLLLACAFGLLWNACFTANGMQMPPWTSRTFELLGRFALPLALITVGSRIAATPLRGIILPVLFGALIKTALGPLVVIVIARFTGADPLATGVAAILSGCPTAVSAQVMVEHLDGDGTMAAGVIVLSVLLSAVTLSITISVLG